MRSSRYKTIKHAKWLPGGDKSLHGQWAIGGQGGHSTRSSDPSPKEFVMPFLVSLNPPPLLILSTIASTPLSVIAPDYSFTSGFYAAREAEEPREPREPSIYLSRGNTLRIHHVRVLLSYGRRNLRFEQ